MAWFVLARALFVAAVAYTAYQLQPVTAGGLAPNIAFGVVLAALIVFLEIRLKTAPVTHMIGALIGGAIGLGAAKVLGDALYWANLGDGRVVFLHGLILLALPYLGLVIGARKGEWLELVRRVTNRRYEQNTRECEPRHCGLPGASNERGRV